MEANSDGSFELDLASGAYHVCAVPVPGSPRRVNPTATCFPSTPIRDRFSAAVVQTKPGERVGPLRITLGLERVYSIGGHVLTEIPKLPGWGTGAWAISERPNLEIGDSFPEKNYYEGSVNQTGEFTIRGVPAGEYCILVEAGPPLLCDTCALPPRFRATVRIRVEHDVKGIIAKLLPNISVTGRLIADSGEERTPIEERLISLDSGLPSYLNVEPPLGRVTREGLFHIDDVPPGSYTGQVLPESQDFLTVRQNGRLAAGNLARIESGSAADLEISLRRATTSILVKVDGEMASWPSNPLSLVAVPADSWDDPYSWTGPFWVQNKGPITLIVGRPGRYFVLATQNLAGYTIEAWREELRRHDKDAATVVARDGATETVTVRPVMLNATDVGPNGQKSK